MTAGLGSGQFGRVFTRRGRRCRRPDERGYSLVEILVTVWIMGGVMVALFGALFSTITASDLQNRTTLVETELRHYSEAVNAAVYHPCASSSGVTPISYAYTPQNVGYVPDATVTASWTWSSTVTLWNKSADAGSPIPAHFDGDLSATAPAWQLREFFSSGASCDHTKGYAPDDGMEQITLTVTDGGSPPISKSTTIIKRDARATP